MFFAEREKILRRIDRMLIKHRMTQDVEIMTELQILNNELNRFEQMNLDEIKKQFADAKQLNFLENGVVEIYMKDYVATIQERPSPKAKSDVRARGKDHV